MRGCLDLHLLLGRLDLIEVLQELPLLALLLALGLNQRKAEVLPEILPYCCLSAFVDLLSLAAVYLFLNFLFKLFLDEFEHATL